MHDPALFMAGFLFLKTIIKHSCLLLFVKNIHISEHNVKFVRTSTIPDE